MVKAARACFIGFLLYSTFFIMLKVWCWCNKMEEEGYLEAIESMRNQRRYQSQCFDRSTLNIRPLLITCCAMVAMVEKKLVSTCGVFSDVHLRP